MLLQRLEDRGAGRDAVAEDKAEEKATEVTSGDPEETAGRKNVVSGQQGRPKKGKGKEIADTAHAPAAVKAAKTPGARPMDGTRRTDSGGSHPPLKTPGKSKVTALAPQTSMRPPVPFARPSAPAPAAAPHLATPGPSGLTIPVPKDAVGKTAPKATSQTASGPKSSGSRVYVGKTPPQRTPALPRMNPSFTELNRDDDDDGRTSTPEQQSDPVGKWFATPCTACLGKFECLYRPGAGQRLACAKCHRLKGKCSNAGVDIPRVAVNPQVLKKPGAGTQQDAPAALKSGGKRKKEADSGEQGPRKKKRGTPPPESEVESKHFIYIV